LQRLTLRSSTPCRSLGVFSIAVLDANRLAIVGGDYDHPQMMKPNSAYSDDGGRTWKESSHRPAGYRWCVAIVRDTPGPTAFAAGPTGTDYSIDGGKNWNQMNEVGANTIAFADSQHGWARGAERTDSQIRTRCTALSIRPPWLESAQKRPYVRDAQSSR